MKMRHGVLCLLGLLLNLHLSEGFGAQSTTSGELTGVVSDSSHAVVADASVEISDNSKGMYRVAKTDRDGMFRFSFLAPGSYSLSVSHPGFRKERRNINVLLGPPSRLMSR